MASKLLLMFHKVPVLMGKSWTPKSPVDGVLPALWLDADDLAGNDGDAVASWTSKGSVTSAFAQSDNDKKPLLKKAANGINGHNTVLFDGSNDLLTIAQHLINTASGMVFAVYRLTAALKDYEIVLDSSLAAVNTRYVTLAAIDVAATTPNAWISQRNADTMDSVRGDGVKTAGTPYITCWQSIGTAWVIRTNGVTESLTVTNANSGDWWSDTTIDTWTIGARKNNTQEILFLKGDLAMLLAYSTSLSAAAISQVERYLGRRFGITVPP